MNKKRIYVAVGIVAAIGAGLFLIGPKPDTKRDNSKLVAESGAETMQITDQKHDRTIDVSVWKPETASSQLIVISHGFDGDRTSHNELATKLVDEGFVVAAPTHPDRGGLDDGDADLDPLTLRPRHLQLTIDQLTESNPVPVEDVTVIGHSLGGYSALRVAGATPTSDGTQQHCEQHIDDAVLCSEAAKSRIDTLVVDTPDMTQPNVDRIVLLAPGYGPLFADTELQGLQVPSMTVQANDDTELVGDQVERLQQTLNGTDAIDVEGGHYVFLRTCTTEEKSDLAELCEDPEGVDRSAVQLDLATQITNFIAAN